MTVDAIISAGYFRVLHSSLHFEAMFVCILFQQVLAVRWPPTLAAVVNLVLTTESRASAHLLVEGNLLQVLLHLSGQVRLLGADGDWAALAQVACHSAKHLSVHSELRRLHERQVCRKSRENAHTQVAACLGTTM